MAASTAFPFARTAAAFAAYERNAREAVCWAHPSWLAGALGVEAGALEGLRAALASAARAQVEACSLALLRTLGVQAPSFDALRAPNLAVLDALPPQWGLRVLRMRSLALRRADVRRLIDKRNRMQLSECVGVPLDKLTGGTSGTANAPDIARLTARGLLPALDRLDADTLAYEGYALMTRDARSIAAPFALLRLVLPRDLPASPWLDDGGRELDAGGTAQLVARLPELLPEWAWLFG
ncbi:type III secretion protein HrpB4 [Paraburkholderia fungorum]|nr:type III secretion protein HrpB4 [Paraburkholderia fungorum]